MNTNTLTSTNSFPSIFVNSFAPRITGLNYWKVTMVFLLTLTIGGYALGMITGWAMLILISSIGLAFLLNPIVEILHMDLDLTDLKINDLHEELWQ